MATTITYTQQGDYLLPDLKLPEQPKVEIGVFGQRHKRYLKEHHRLVYPAPRTAAARGLNRTTAARRTALPPLL